MDFEVTVSSLLPPVSGQSARGEWKKQEVIFELPGEFSRKLCVGFWNDRAAEAGALKPGDRVALSVNVESREYNGRWYTEVRAWRMSRMDGQGAGAAQTSSGGYPPFGGGGQSSYQSSGQQSQGGGYSSSNTESAASSSEVDDLPF